MKRRLRIDFILLWTAVLSPIAPAWGRNIPTNDFFRSVYLQIPELSPNGENVAFLLRTKDQLTLHFQNLSTRKVVNIRHSVGWFEEAPYKFLWINDRRLAYCGVGWAALDIDGRNWIGLTGRYRDGSGWLDGMDIDGVIDGGKTLLMSKPGRNAGADFPDVIGLNHLTGEFTVREKNPGNVVFWLPDHAGNMRFAGVLHGAHVRYQYRADVHAAWTEFSRDDDEVHALFPLAFDDAEKGIWVVSPNTRGFWCLSRFDLSTGQVQELFSVPGFDVAPPESAQFGQEGLVISRDRKKVLGVKYVTDRPRTHWIDPDLRRSQSEIDAALPAKLNTIMSSSDGAAKSLVLSWSDRSPGIYYIYDRIQGTLTKFAERMPWINENEMAAMKPIQFEARDGVGLRGFLTLPASGPNQPPMIVLVHGGPWFRDTWGFNPEVQFLANRGYSVLQINYRGSPGYGIKTMDAAKKQIGGKIQDDITDGVRWAIQQGIADPKRIAIMGASYGGYSALWGAAFTPDLYRCAIDICGPSDWTKMLEHRRDQQNQFVYDYWAEKIGDLKSDAALLRSISPANHVSTIRAPILLIHGTEDETVPIDQTDLMIDRLIEGRKTYEKLILKEEGHGFFKEADQIKIHDTVEAFLAKHLPANHVE